MLTSSSLPSTLPPEHRCQTVSLPPCPVAAPSRAAVGAAPRRGSRPAAAGRTMGDEEKVDQRQFKVILLGDGAVGKTSIATRFSHDEFTQSYKQTIGLDFFIKHLILPGAASPETASFFPRDFSAGDVHVAMQMWDIGGQQGRTRVIQRSFNVSVPRARVPEKASTRRERSEG